MMNEVKTGETELEYWKRIADQRAEQWDRAVCENLAWRSRFPQYEYRAQDDLVALKLKPHVIAAVQTMADFQKPHNQGRNP